MDSRLLNDAIYRIGRLSANTMISSDALLTRLAEALVSVTGAEAVGIAVYEHGIDRAPSACRTVGNWPEAGPGIDSGRAVMAAMVTDLPRERLAALPETVCDDEVLCERMYSDLHRTLRPTDRTLSIFRRDDGSELVIALCSTVTGQPIARETLAKATHLTLSIAACWAAAYRHEPAWMASLSPSSRRVLQNLLEGCDDNQIAERTGLTYHSVRAHLKRIFRDAGVRSRLHLIQTCRSGVRPVQHIEQPAAHRGDPLPIVTVSPRRPTNNGAYSRTG